MISMLLAFAFQAHAATPLKNSDFRYRVFVPTTVDCAFEVASLKTRFQNQTGLTVIDTNCAAVSLPGPMGEPDFFTANAATLIYSAKHEVEPASIVLGTGLGGQGAVGLAGDISGAYDTLADCQGDVDAQTATFRQETGAEPVAVYCAPAGNNGLRIALHLESFRALAKQLFVFESFDDEAADANNAHVASLVRDQGVAVARTHRSEIYFYDGLAKSGQPARMNLRSSRVTLFNSASECASEQPLVDGLFKAAGFTAYDVACTGGIAVSGLEVVSARSFGFMNYGRDAYASLAECNADVARVSRDAASHSRDFIGGFCAYTGDPLDALRAYGVVALYR